VLRITSCAMAEQGFVFYLSENSVWLIERGQPDSPSFRVDRSGLHVTKETATLLTTSIYRNENGN
jgi:hypothetical protein